MTNEEAIKVLRLFKECNAETQPQIVFDSIDNAIAAFKNIDLIKSKLEARDKLVDKLENRVYQLKTERDALIEEFREWNMCSNCCHWLGLEVAAGKQCRLRKRHTEEPCEFWEWKGLVGNEQQRN